ncbi:MAG TPA: response regulator transcription factor, partial [Chloroflexota bacterium]|nr:response regulator transcription factor [Chloroflexota bacterium]
MKVLVVEDDEELLDLLTYALRREGYTVLGAADGQQALDRFEREQPDLVMLDGNLPRMDGFEVCRRIRHEYRSNVPTIMLTGRDKEADVVKGLDMGADDYVVKPFSTKQLTARMRALLRRSRSDKYRAPAAQVEAGDITLDLDS